MAKAKSTWFGKAPPKSKAAKRKPMPGGSAAAVPPYVPADEQTYARGGVVKKGKKP